MYEKLKSFASHDGLYTTILLLLVGVVSFGLGRQSVLSSDLSYQAPAGIIFTEAAPRENIFPTASVSPSVPSTETSTSFVASRTGTKYHRTDCPGAKQIKEENKLYFTTTELARAAGYTPAANCPNLK